MTTRQQQRVCGQMDCKLIVESIRIHIKKHYYLYYASVGCTLYLVITEYLTRQIITSVVTTTVLTGCLNMPTPTAQLTEL